MKWLIAGVVTFSLLLTGGFIYQVERQEDALLDAGTHTMMGRLADVSGNPGAMQDLADDMRDYADEVAQMPAWADNTTLRSKIVRDIRGRAAWVEHQAEQVRQEQAS